MEHKRFIVHDFLIGSPILIDRQRNMLVFYSKNMYGQIYNLKKPECHVIDGRKISGLIHRLNSGDYDINTGRAVDGYIHETI